MSYYEDINRGFEFVKNGGVGYFTVPSISNLGIYTHAFTTRIGGVSDDVYTSLNLSLTREENRKNVAENYSRLANALDLPLNTLTACHYEHGDGVCVITPSDIGAGIHHENTLPFCDGVIIKEHGVTAVTLHADCVPLFFADKHGRAAGVCHAGWKGTYKKISHNMIAALGVPVSDILIAIGPSIGSCCFEVQEDVGGLFVKEYGEQVREWRNGRQYIDLWHVTALQLEDAGIPAKNVTLSGLCTYCSEDLFYSHRRDKGHTGAMASVIAFK